MTVLADLVGDLSWALRAAWMAWGIWIVFQLMWFRRARVDARSGDMLSYDRATGRSPLSISDRSDRVRVSAPTPAPGVSAAEASISDPLSPAPLLASDGTNSIESVSAPLEEPAKRPKRRRRSSRDETAGVMTVEAV
jgi:hypothetical protein